MTPDAIRTLNDNCFCVPVHQADLDHLLSDRIGTKADALRASHPHLFAETSVFVSAQDLATMMAAVKAIEHVAAMDVFGERVLAQALGIARNQSAALGVFMGYDFHLSDEGPKLIEINTNAGGAFLNAMLGGLRSTCCTDGSSASTDRDGLEAFADKVVSMFEHEWALDGGKGKLATIAIVDDDPENQYLYPEFQLAKSILQERGYAVVIADPGQLDFDGEKLRLNGTGIDLVYNRLTDFYLESEASSALNAAWSAGKVVLTPNPVHHARLACKSNLSLLSDTDFLSHLVLDPETRAALSVVPMTRPVLAEDGDRLWSERKRLFFKPVSGHAGKAVYRGDKLTRSVFAEILKGGYVAQARIEPSGRSIALDGAIARQKVDVRLYTYDGELLLAAARLYQGQTTNFRTPGGGFAPIIVV